MKSSYGTLLLISAGLSGTFALGTLSAPVYAQAPANTAPLVTGLPDFTRLVDRVGPGVVNIEVQIGGEKRTASRGGRNTPETTELPEIFRRIFGPDMPFPGFPGGEEGGRSPRSMGLGSGFILSADGYILTNHHVVSGANNVKVKLPDRREFTAKVVGSDEQYDVALLKVEASGLPFLKTGNAAQVKPGQWAIAIGSPFGLDHSVTAGIVSAVGRANPFAGQQYVPFIQTDVAINQGNSGGPLLNTNGEVIGINSQIFSNSGGYMGVSFAIPIDIALNAVEQIKTSGKVSRGALGAQFQPQITNEIAKSLKLPDTRGALISDVTPGSGAEKAGLQAGDVVRSVNGTDIYEFSNLPPIIGAMKPGAKVKLGIMRNGQDRTVDVTLGSLDNAQAALGTEPRAGDPAQSGRAPNAQTNSLGITGRELTARERSQLGLEGKEGVAIAAVQSTRARQVGLRPGDVILRVGNTSVADPAALNQALGRIGKDDTVILLVKRGNSSQFIAIEPDSQE